MNLTPFRKIRKSTKRDAWFSDDEEWDAYTKSDEFKQIVKDQENEARLKVERQKTQLRERNERNERNQRKNQRKREQTPRRSFRKSENTKKKIPFGARQKTKMCQYVLQKKKCPYKTCFFAHTFADLSPLPCNYDKKCKQRFKQCTFLHSDETKNDLCRRLKLNGP